VNIQKKLCQKNRVVVRSGAYILCCKKGVGGAGKKLELNTNHHTTHSHHIPHTIIKKYAKKFAQKNLFPTRHCFPPFHEKTCTKKAQKKRVKNA
jgi:hypothetical protein